MISTYVIGFCLAFIISLVTTPYLRNLALKVGIVDKPNARKVHQKPIPRIGGLAIAVAFLVPFLLLIELNRTLLGLLGGVLILLAVGLYDDTKGLGAWYKLGFQILAALVVLAGGLGIIYFSNPISGGIIALDEWRIPLEIFGRSINIIPLANFVSVLWIVGMINTVNFLDGLDGLAGGISSIAALVLFILALTSPLGSAVVAVIAIILLGALLGFLPYNFHPSSIFMGDSGAYVIGLLLAVLSIYSGSKVAVGAIVLGFAIFDAIWAVLRRVYKKQSPFKPDRGHLHHQMLDSGLLSHRQVVIILYLLTVIVAILLLVFGGLVAFATLILLLVSVVSIMRIMAPLKARKS